MNTQNENRENEIELIDILKIIYKWKLMIFLITFLVVGTTFILSAKMDKIYRVKLTIAPGVLEITENDKKIFVDSVENIQAVIDAGIFDTELLKLVDQEKIKGFKFKTSIQKQSNILVVSYETAFPEDGKKILNELYRQLKDKYKNSIKFYDQKFAIQIDSKQNKINQLLHEMEKTQIESKVAEAELKELMETLSGSSGKATAEMKALKTEIENLENFIIETNNEKDEIEKNTKQLILDRNKLLESLQGKDKDSVFPLIMYSTTIQQNIAFASALSNRVSSKRSAINNNFIRIGRFESELIENKNKIKGLNDQIALLKKDVLSKVKKLTFDKEYLEDEINDLKFKCERVQSIRLLSEAVQEKKAIGPKVFLNLVVSGMVSLVLTFFLAFMLEYIQGVKRP